MVKNKLVVRVLSSGMQAIAVQVLGGIFFYLISVYLTKQSFGIINWMNAVSLFITTILGFGLEQIVVRRVASSKTSDWAAAAFFFHSIIGFAVTLLLLIGASRLMDNNSIYRYLPWFFAAQGLTYTGVPLKQLLNAKEKFTPYGIIALVSNAGKILAVYLTFKDANSGISPIIIIMISAAAFELICLFIYTIAKSEFRLKFKFKAYTRLLKESAAQYLSVIFDTSLSRLDWILLGILSTNIVLADYSFAYRAYELARLPILIMAPIILPRISRLMLNKPDPDSKQLINSFNTMELFFAMMIPLALNILWLPLVNYMTHGKYGETNATQFLILSLCIPLQFSINLMWSLCFGARQYKAVTTITIISAVLNLALNLILMPLWAGLGAAIAFFITTFIQFACYHILLNRRIMKMALSPIILFFASAAVLYVASAYINAHFVIRLVIVLLLYVLIGLLSGLVHKDQLRNFKQFLSQ